MGPQVGHSHALMQCCYSNVCVRLLCGRDASCRWATDLHCLQHLHHWSSCCVPTRVGVPAWNAKLQHLWCHCKHVSASHAHICCCPLVLVRHCQSGRPDTGGEEQEEENQEENQTRQG